MNFGKSKNEPKPEAEVATIRKPTLSGWLEVAMVKAVEDCAKEKITDPDKIRERMNAYRKKAKQMWEEAHAPKTEPVAPTTEK